ncbi:hypothetical protein [Pseudomonas sp. RIT-PI-S]|uniref:hypothetical protein n=1 Tax=Pseudomonas sp. RIT-PI-S TaxID=3035295 RepID=UPI0021D97672|nr:hypothetical protein [Pseudomonas sp. RIT-PI-S]
MNAIPPYQPSPLAPWADAKLTRLDRFITFGHRLLKTPRAHLRLGEPLFYPQAPDPDDPSAVQRVSVTDYLQQQGLNNVIDHAGLRVALDRLEQQREERLAALDAQAPNIDCWLGPVDEQAIKAVCAEYTEGERHDLLSLLADEVLENYSTARIARLPATLMAYVTARALDGSFVRHLLDQLGWYAGDARSPTSPRVISRLLRKAVALHLDPHRNLAGFKIYSPAYRGKTFPHILQALAAYWVEAGIVADRSVATFALYCLRANMPPELRCPTLPASLPFLSSSAWVEIAQAARLVNVLAPAALERLPYQQLLKAAQRVAAFDHTTARAQYLSCLAEPAWHWANAQVNSGGTVLPTLEGYARAVEAYLSWHARLHSAAQALSRPMPKRLELVDLYLYEHALDPDELCIPNSLAVGFFNRSLRDLVATGALLEDPLAWTPFSTRPFFGSRWPKQFEDISAQFDSAFTRWADQQVLAIRDLASALLDELDAENRSILTHGVVQMYSVREEALSVEAYNDAAHPLIIASTGRGGVVMTSDFEGRRYVYEWLPGAGWLGRRDDINDLVIGGEVYDTGKGSGPVYGNHYSFVYRLATDLPLDWQAYSTGVPPRPEAHGQLILTRVATFDAHQSESRPRLEALAHTFAHTFFAAGMPALRDTARGQVPSERPSRLLGIVKALVPFWSSIENIQQWRETGDYGALKDGLYGLTFDAFTTALPAAKLVATTARLAKTTFHTTAKWAIRKLGGLSATARSSLAASAPSSAEELSRLFALAGDAANTALARSLRAQDGLARQVLPTSTQVLGGVITEASGESLKAARLGMQLEIAVSTALGDSKGLLLVDAQNLLPFGPALPLSAPGDRLFVAPDVLPIVTKFGRPAIELDHSGLAIQWFRQDDELTLMLGGTPYRQGRAASGEIALIRQREWAPEPQLWPLPCRRARTPGLDCVANNTFATRNYHGLEAVTATEAGPVSWFEHFKINAQGGRLVHGRQVHRIVGNELRIERRVVRYGDYKPRLAARLLGGNQIFKRIRIEEGLIPGVSDSREVSAVVVRHRPSATLRLVTRVDKDLFYAASLADGDALQLEKLSLTREPENVTTYTDDDHLANIYVGSLDANRLIARQGEARMNEALANLSDEVVAAREEAIAPFFTERFELATTRKMAVLYNRYARRAVVEAIRENATYIHALTPHTPLQQLEAIAAQVNELFVRPGQFGVADLYDPARLRAALGTRNLAYLAVELVKDGQPLKEVYFSLSGLRRSESALPLANTLPAGWREEGLAKVSPGGVRYIDCQPRTIQYTSVVWLPDLNKRSTFMHYLENPRTLDSERNILVHLTNHPIDHQAVRRAVLYTQRPACPSCLTGIEAFQHALAPGSFTLFEGP